MTSPNKKKLFIIDAFGLFFKAFFALQNSKLTSPQGLPTGAIFGFCNMIKKILASEKPDYLVVAIDQEGKTFREELFKDYKANRPETPSELIQQLPYIPKICEVFNLSVFGVKGFEADDVIGTLCHRTDLKDIDIVIVSSDKDLFQLVNDHIVMMDIRKGNEIAYYTPKTGEEKFGVPPSKMIDKLSLTGDASDNVPGAPGIGEKGAIQLLKDFASLDYLLQHPEEVKNKRARESLQKHKDQILLSRDLVTLKTDLNFPFQLQDYEVKGINRERAEPFFKELQFRNFLKELDLNEEPKKMSRGSAIIFPSQFQWFFYEKKKLPEFAKTTTRLCCIPCYGDREGTGGPFHLQAILFHEESGETIHCLKTSHPEFVSWFHHFLKKNKATVLLYNLKNLERAFQYFYPELTFSVKTNRVRDLLLIVYLCDPNRRDFSMPHLTQQFLNEEISEKIWEEFRLQIPQFHEDQPPNAFSEMLLKEVEKYFFAYWNLDQEFSTRLDASLEKIYQDIELPLSLVLAQIENRGIYCDIQHLKELSKEFTQILGASSSKIYKIAGEEFNINSPKQLGSILFEKLKFPSSKKTKGGEFSTNEEVLTQLSIDHEFPAEVLHYRHFSKLKSTYIDALPELVNATTHRIHTTFHQTGASTGRLSSTNPNLQNIPIRTPEGQKIREAFQAEENCLLLSADYSQIELRIFAHLSEDPVLCDAFLKNEDIHERTAREIFGNYLEFEKQEMRRRAKTINFGVIYGQSPYGLAMQLGIPQKEAKTFIENYFERYKGVKKWLDQAIEDAKKKGVATTLFGRTRLIQEIKSSNKVLRGIGERTAINTPVQGTAADLIKMAMIKVEEAMVSEKLQSKMILTVHDELVFEVPLKEVATMKTLVQQKMERIYTLRVPLVVNIATGKTWASAK